MIAMNPQSSMGSMISQQQLERVDKMINHRKFGTVVAGGHPMSGKSALDGHNFSQGCFYPPTVIADVSTEDDIWKEEIFGPVVVVKQFKVRYLCVLSAIPMMHCR